MPPLRYDKPGAVGATWVAGSSPAMTSLGAKEVAQRPRLRVLPLSVCTNACVKIGEGGIDIVFRLVRQHEAGDLLHFRHPAASLGKHIGHASREPCKQRGLA